MKEIEWLPMGDYMLGSDEAYEYKIGGEMTSNKTTLVITERVVTVYQFDNPKEALEAAKEFSKNSQKVGVKNE